MNNVFECGICKSLHSVREWEIETFKGLNRKERRRVISFSSDIVKHKLKSTVYKCPSCNEYVPRVSIVDKGIEDSTIF